jgi:hypothetical protein
MSQTTSRYRKAAKPSSTTRTKAHRSSSSSLQAVPKRRRVDPNAPSYIVAGAVIMMVGLGLAVGLAMTASGPEVDRGLAVKIAPWIVVAGGIALSVFGFLHMGKGERESH